MILGVLSSSLEQIIRPFGYTSDDATFLITIIIISGIVGLIPNLAYIKRTNKYRKLIIINALTFLLAWGGMIAVIDYREVDWILYSASMMAGVAFSAVTVLGIEFACEVGFPVGESYSNGMIQISGAVLAFLATFLAPMLLN